MRDPNTGDDNPTIGRLKRRADFLRVGKGRRWHGKAMTVQALARQDDDPGARIGFTLTRKVGSAVIRNRARRRLREAVRLGAAVAVRPGHDYVIVGRIDAIRLSFEDLKRELDRAIRGAHGAKGALPRTRPERTRPSS